MNAKLLRSKNGSEQNSSFSTCITYKDVGMKKKIS